jgi:hypothetical protein
MQKKIRRRKRELKRGIMLIHSALVLKDFLKIVEIK